MQKRPSGVLRLLQSAWAIAFAALVLRVMFLADFTLQNSRRALATIPFLFEPANIAAALATGQGFSSPLRVPTGPTAWCAPVYPLLLAGIFRVFGLYTYQSFLVAETLNVLFSAGTAWFIARLGSGVMDPALGAVAGWIWAIFPNAILIAFEDVCWEATLTALLTTLVMLRTLRLWQQKSRWAWAGYGALWGLVLLTNPTLSSVFVLLLSWLIWKSPGGTRGRRSCTTLAAVVLCCSPWTVRNALVFHQWIPIRSTLGLQLWMGNSAHADPIWLGTEHPIFNAAERERYILLGEPAYMREKEKAALHYMMHHPRRAAALAARRFIALWAGGTPYPFRDWSSYRSWWFRYVLAFNLVLAGAAAIGLICLLRQRHPCWFPLSTLPVVYPFAYYLTLAIPRYRLPADPVVALLAAIGWRSCNRLGCRRWLRIRSRICGANAGVV